MSFFVLAAVMFATFATCRWGGRTLSGHYQDGWEVAAVAAMGVCAFLALWLVKNLTTGASALPMIGLVAAAAGGLIAGYMRGERA